jgi:hypothetical protein
MCGQHKKTEKRRGKNVLGENQVECLELCSSQIL